MIKNVTVVFQDNTSDLDLTSPYLVQLLKNIKPLDLVILEAYLKYAYKVVKHERQLKEGYITTFPVQDFYDAIPTKSDPEDQYS